MALPFILSRAREADRLFQRLRAAVEVYRSLAIAPVDFRR